MTPSHVRFPGGSRERGRGCSVLLDASGRSSRLAPVSTGAHCPHWSGKRSTRCGVSSRKPL